MSDIIYQIRKKSNGDWYERGISFVTKDQSRSPIYVSRENAEKKINELGRIQKRQYSNNSKVLKAEQLEVVKVRLIIDG